jgi:quaternary ammonium compound-resistance protein SugE
MAWTLLIVAGILEIVWLVALKRSDGFAHAGYGAASVATAWLSFALLAHTLRTLPAGTAYAVWTGVGAAGGAVVGMLLFGESREIGRLLCLAMIVAGIVGVELTQ